jgi:serine/threonine protein kinase
MAEPGSASYRDKSSLLSAGNWGNQPRYGEYEIVVGKDGRRRLLGEGSFGKTYEAVRTDEVAGNVIQEFAALKVLDPALMSSESKRKQFVKELVALTKFKHSNLIHYIRCGEHQGEVYYAMELCRGGDLSQLVGRYGPLPEKAAALIGLQVATGLREMHQRHQLVHRDIKPSNIMLVDELAAGVGRQNIASRLEEQDSLCRIVDFGLVDVTLNAGVAGKGQRFAGSPMYASPEQVREQPVDGRSDIYSLGMTLWFLVQGKGPLLDHQGMDIRDHVEALRRHTHPSPHDVYFPQQLTDTFRKILSRMVAKNPDERYANAAEVQAALRGYLAEIGGGSTPVAGISSDAPPVLRIQQPLEMRYAIEHPLPERMGRRCFQVIHTQSGQRLKLTLVADLENGAPEGLEETTAELCRLVNLSRDPDFPAGIMRVREVVWASDVVAVIEEIPDAVILADVLRVRTEMRRPISYPEAAGLMQPLAESLDYLVDNNIKRIHMPAEEVWLASARNTAEMRADESLLGAPLNEWPGLTPVFSMLWLPEDADDLLASRSVQHTVSNSLQLSESASHPVSAFCRLVYKIVSGTEIASAVEVVPSAYVQTAALCAASNNLLRDIISSKEVDRPRVRALLNDLNIQEGVMKSSRSTSGATRANRSAYAPPGTATQLHATRFSGSATVFGSAHGAGATRHAGDPPPLPEGDATPAPSPPPLQPTRKIDPKFLAIAAAVVLAFAVIVMGLASFFNKGDSVTQTDPVKKDPLEQSGSSLASTPTPTPPAPTPVTVPALPPAAQPPALTVPGGYPTIQAALLAAKPGETVRIQPGSYEEQIRLPDGVSLAAMGEGRRVLISVDGKVGSVLEVDGCKKGGTVTGIVFSHSGTDTAPGGDSPVVSITASSITFTDCVFEKGIGDGLLISATSRVSLSKCESRRNRGHGFHIKNASAEITGCLSESNLLDGLRAFGAGGNVVLGQSTMKRNSGTGAVAENGASITATESGSQENSENGLAAQGADSLLNWTGGNVRGNGVIMVGGAARDSGKGGLGISVEKGGARLIAQGVQISGNHKHGIVMESPASGSALLKCRILDNQRSGVVIFGESGASVKIEGGEIANSHEDGLIVSGRGFQPQITGLSVTDSTLTGLTVYDGAEPQITASQFERNRQGAIVKDEAGPGMTVK